MGKEDWNAESSDGESWKADLGLDCSQTPSSYNPRLNIVSIHENHLNKNSGANRLSAGVEGSLHDGMFDGLRAYMEVAKRRVGVGRCQLRAQQG